MTRILHVGCGGERLPDWIEGEETRLDIDPQHKPDIVASMIDMGDIGGFDIVYSSHSLEHLYPHDVRKALKEFHRVLAPGGMAIIIVPDLEDVKPTEEILFESPSGPIAGLDLYYGARWLLETMPFMAHHTAFVEATLDAELAAAGFINIITRRCPGYNLLGVGVK